MFLRNGKDLASGLFLLAVGIFLALQALPLSLWTRAGPEAGFFPLIIGVIIMGFSLILIGGSLGAARARRDEKINEAQIESSAGFSKVLSYAILMLAYGLLVESLGFLLASAALLFLILKWLEKQNWRSTLLVGFSSILGGYFLFKFLLGVPLPEGLLKWW